MQQEQPPADFGVVIPTRAEHLHWVRGTCASVRHFMPDAPICVLLDGDGFTDDLRDTYGVLVLDGREVEPRELRERSFGSLKAKNAALWASPFETFLLLDADAIVWGDMRSLADFDRFDFVLDIGGREPIGSIMDLAAVGKHFPEFDATRHVSDFANTGTYFGRRGTLDLDRYLHVLRTSERHPEMFFYGDQGIFNFMVFSAADEGSVRVHQRELQVMTGHTPQEDVVRRFAFRDGQPVVVGDPAVLHWVGTPKPRVREGRHDHFEPMTYFRLRFRTDARSRVPSAADRLWLRYEDAMCADRRGKNVRGRALRFKRRAGFRYAELKAGLRRRTPDSVVRAIKRHLRLITDRS